jgi:hypothetical protein
MAGACNNQGMPEDRSPHVLAATRQVLWGTLTRILRRDSFCAVVILVLVLQICFFPFIWGDSTLLESSRNVESILPDGAWTGGSVPPQGWRGPDAGAPAWESEPYISFTRDQYLAEHRPPLWNPSQGFGAPFAANMQSQVFNPLLVVLSLHLTPATYNLFLLLRLLVGGLCAYFFLRLFLPFTPALAGGITCMLSGYYILYLTMPHLSVDVLAPAVLLATERLLRDQTPRTILLAVAVVWLVLVGGMPESALLVLSFGYAYFVFRVLSDRALRISIFRHAAYSALVTTLAFMLAAPLLLPFAEFMNLSFDTHQAANMGGHVVGLLHDKLDLSIATYLIPLIFPITGGNSGIRGYFGVLPVLLGVFAIISLARGAALRARSSHASLIVFFGGCCLSLLLKRFGFPLVNWVGRLPLFNLVFFAKYDEPLLSLAISALCALGLSIILARQLSRRQVIAGVALIGGALGLVYLLALPLVNKIAGGAQYLPSLYRPLVLLVFATILLLWPPPERSAPRQATGAPTLAAFLTMLLVAELATNFIAPVYYRYNREPSVARNPYQGAPYLTFLKARQRNQDRLFGRDGVLHPNWATVFGLPDIRNLDALYYKKYFPFLRTFLPVPRHSMQDTVSERGGGELKDRFTGVGDYAFVSRVEKRLLQLSSVRFIITVRPYEDSDNLPARIVDQNQGHLAEGRGDRVHVGSLRLFGRSKVALIERPPYDRLPVRVDITAEKRWLHFSVAVDPSGPSPGACMGAEFRLEVRERQDRTTLLYRRLIDPGHNAADAAWFQEIADLRQYIGQSVELLFSVLPGSGGGNCPVAAGWGDLYLGGSGTGDTDVKRIYDAEAKIYEFDNVLPRASVFHDVEVVPDQAAALRRLAAASFDIFHTAVVSATDVNAADEKAVAEVHQPLPERAAAAKITGYSSQSVEIDATLDRPGMLVLNDVDYPGWKAYVDGHKARWITANYLFRGVLLAPGSHVVRFQYEPASFRLGVLISVIGLVLLCSVVVWKSRTRRLGGWTSRDTSSGMKMGAPRRANVGLRGFGDSEI